MIAPETSSSQWKSSVDSKQHETWATRSGDLTIAGGRGGDCTEGMWGPLRGQEEDVMTRLVTRPRHEPRHPLGPWCTQPTCLVQRKLHSADFNQNRFKQLNKFCGI